jgi:hypothetical protein
MTLRAGVKELFLVKGSGSADASDKLNMAPDGSSIALSEHGMRLNDLNITDLQNAIAHFNKLINEPVDDKGHSMHARKRGKGDDAVEKVKYAGVLNSSDKGKLVTISGDVLTLDSKEMKDIIWGSSAKSDMTDKIILSVKGLYGGSVGVEGGLVFQNPGRLIAPIDGPDKGKKAYKAPFEDAKQRAEQAEALVIELTEQLEAKEAEIERLTAAGGDGLGNEGNSQGSQVEKQAMEANMTTLLNSVGTTSTVTALFRKVISEPPPTGGGAKSAAVTRLIAFVFNSK